MTSTEISNAIMLNLNNILFGIQKNFKIPGDSDGKESSCNVGDLGSVPRLGRSPGEGNGYHSTVFPWRIPWTEEPSCL